VVGGGVVGGGVVGGGVVGGGVVGGGVLGGGVLGGGVLDVGAEEVDVTGAPPPPQPLSANSARPASSEVCRNKRMMIPSKSLLSHFVATVTLQSKCRLGAT
jgi:hypothetical protein